MTDQRWLSVDEIAAHLGVQRDTIYGWITTRGLPAHRVGRLWKFNRAEVDEWVRRGGARSDDRPLPGDEPSDDSHEAGAKGPSR
jgi:excisionase family DNA binding protein